MFSLGTPIRRPSALRPDLMAMQSSPVSNMQFSMSTLRHDSGSQPSLFGPWLLTVTPRIGDVFAEHGVHDPHRRVGERDAFDEHVLAAIGLDEVRPQLVAGAEHALARPAHCPRPSAAARPGSLLLRPFQGHQFFGPAWPSNVPAPVMRDVLRFDRRRGTASSSSPRCLRSGRARPADSRPDRC